MLVSVKKQRQKFWIDEEPQPEEEVAIALDFVGSPYENEGLSALAGASRKTSEEPVQNSGGDSSCEVAAKAPNEQNDATTGGGYNDFLPSGYTDESRLLDGDQEAQRAFTTHGQGPLDLTPSQRSSQKKWRWALFSVLTHVVVVVVLYVVAQAALQGKFSFILEGGVFGNQQKILEIAPYEGSTVDEETMDMSQKSADISPEKPPVELLERPLKKSLGEPFGKSLEKPEQASVVHMIDLEDVAPRRD